MSGFIHFFKQFRLIFISIALLLLVYFLLRILFLVYNMDLFAGIPARQIGLDFIWGAKLDLSAMVWLNFPVFFLYVLACHFPKKKKIMLRLLLFLFLLINISAVAINVFDIGYFKFAKHRSNTDLFYVWRDSLGSLGSILTGYWPLILFFILLASGLFYVARNLFSFLPFLFKPATLVLYQCIVLAFLFFLARGWEARPLMPASPLLQVDARQLPIAQNSTGTFLYSLVHRQKQLDPKHYFSPEQLDRLISVRPYLGKNPGSGDTMLKKNVVICILESFSREFLEPGNPHKASTPFFDSLIKKSIYFPNAFANGFTSNQGIVAILGGLPAFLDEPFYYSVYANTPLNGIGNVLKDKGYRTNFLMGAGKDHFGFEKFGHMAGIDHYYGRPDFADDRFYDGNWGIYDEPFLQFGAGILAKEQTPFLAVFFTISSHEPFSIPANRKNQFSIPGQSPEQNSISYVDEAFRLFFARCRQSAWFQNSIFVFCADHYFYPGDGSGYTSVSASEIPIFIYQPQQNKAQVDSDIVSQVDITPTVLHLLNYSGSYIGFGADVLDSATGYHYALSKPGPVYQMIDKRFAIGYDPIRERTNYLYKYKTDPQLKFNLIDSEYYSEIRNNMERLLKANIQYYHQSLINRSFKYP
ncbi:MAG TPA: sulfatase-like hydrolase/transferase [Puia sp.]|nr:sulfatase-like hydrolase/transferase [Puia sp.]